MGKKKTRAEGDFPARVVIETNADRQVGTVHIEGITAPESEWESFLEYQAVSTLTACEDVVNVATQRPREKLPDGTYVPDLSVSMVDRAVAIEVKPLSRLFSRGNIERYSEIAQHFRSVGRQLDFLTDDQLESHPRWHNAFLCRRYVSGHIPRTAEELALAKLEAGPRPMRDIIACTDGRVSLVHLYALVARKRLFIDWTSPLDPNALVSLHGRPFKGLTYDHVRRSGRFSDLLEELAMGRRPTDQRRVALAKRRRPERSLGDAWGFVGGLPRGFIRPLE